MDERICIAGLALLLLSLGVLGLFIAIDISEQRRRIDAIVLGLACWALVVLGGGLWWAA